MGDDVEPDDSTNLSWDAIERRLDDDEFRTSSHRDLSRVILDLKARVEELERWKGDVMSPPSLGTLGVVIDGPEDVRSIQERWGELERRPADKVSDGEQPKGG